MKIQLAAVCSALRRKSDPLRVYPIETGITVGHKVKRGTRFDDYCLLALLLVSGRAIHAGGLPLTLLGNGK